MIMYYRKYKDIGSFVRDEPKSKDTPFSVATQCKGLTDDGALCSHCFGCLYCAAAAPEMKDAMIRHFGEDFIAAAAAAAFRGAPVRHTLRQKGVSHPYSSLERFTSVHETRNIQPWATALVHRMCTEPNRISMEVPVFHPDYDRNGRLDICSITPSHMLVMESKTTVDDALLDERFVEQHKKYTEVIDESTRAYTYLTFVGGKDTDIYPESSPFCTGSVGGKASRFLNILRDNGIQALTADALWCLFCLYLTEGDAWAWDRFLPELFRDSACIALVAAGKLALVDGQVQLQPLL